MNERAELKVWRGSGFAATFASSARKSVCDDVSDIVPVLASERTMGASTNKEPLRTQADDAVLARAALVGQVWAQREIWFRFSPMVYGLLRRALGPQHDHEDLTQEVFLRVFRQLHTLEKLGAIRSFVFSVAVRVVSEEVRRFAWRRRIVEQWPVAPEPRTCSPADFEAREMMTSVQRSLDRMRDKHRAVFILRFVEGMDLGDIAAGLGISRASVKRYLAKALAAIQKTVPRGVVGGKEPARIPALSRLFEAG
jgi:RNA polymerase sigma-70 factor, ECF subfamily